MVEIEDILGGEPRIAGHRISVLQVAELVVDADRSPEYVADQLDLSLAEVYATLAYCYDHPERMEAVREWHRQFDAELGSASNGTTTPGR